jgi:outer membrane lipoprotein-sorting protein
MYSLLGGGLRPPSEASPQTRDCAGEARARTRLSAVPLLLLLFVLTSACAVGANEAEELVQKADQVRRPAESFVWKVAVTSTEGAKAPTTDGFEVFVKGTRRSFVKFVAPARNVGRSLLMLDRDLWIYLPDAGRPVRIPLAQRLVGQVSNGDLARVDFAGDYDVTLIGTETVDGVACAVLDLKAKTKDVTYSAIKYWVARDEPRPVKAEFYAGTGTLLKTGSFDPPRDVDSRRLVTRLTFVDAIRKDRKSVLEFGEVKVRDLPDKYFDKNYMKTLD